MTTLALTILFAIDAVIIATIIGVIAWALIVSRSLHDH